MVVRHDSEKVINGQSFGAIMARYNNNCAAEYRVEKDYERAYAYFRAAIALDGPSYAPLRSMHRLLVAQGRHAEAQSYATLLAKREDDDPYHWLGLGMAAMQDSQYRPAIRALERSPTLSKKFSALAPMKSAEY